MTQQQQGRIWDSRMMMRRLISEIRAHGTYKDHGLRGQYPEIFARRWNWYRDAMAEGFAK